MVRTHEGFTPPSLIVHVCRDCCCGTWRKHPEVDHSAQLETLTRTVDSLPGGQIKTTKCVGECRHSNVLIIRRFLHGRTLTTWLGNILRERQTLALCQWLTQGAYQDLPLPSSLKRYAFTPEKQNETCPF